MWGRDGGGRGRIWHHSTFLSLGRELLATVLQEALSKKPIISCVPGLCHFPVLYLSGSWAVSTLGATDLLYFYLQPVAGIQNSQISRGLARCVPTPVPIPEVVVHQYYVVREEQSCSSHTHRLDRVHVTHSGKLQLSPQLCLRKAVAQRLNRLW